MPMASTQQNQMVNYAVQRELPVLAGSNTFYLNFFSSSSPLTIACYAALSATFNVTTLP